MTLMIKELIKKCYEQMNKECNERDSCLNCKYGIHIKEFANEDLCSVLDRLCTNIITKGVVLK